VLSPLFAGQHSIAASFRAYAYDAACRPASALLENFLYHQSCKGPSQSLVSFQ
jgi:hypothetical protein